MINLFEEIVNDDKMHENFKGIKDDQEIKKIINEWANGFEDRDGKFVNEFQTTFNSSFWELYCFAIFKKLNLDVNFKYDRPDFVLEKEQIKFNVECVVSNNANGCLEESDFNGKLYDNTSVEEKVYNQTLRLLNSINYKKNKYKKNYSKLPIINENSFIIALAPFDQPRTMDVALEAIHMVLYGLNYDKKTLDELKILSVKKNEDIFLNLGIFTDNSYEDISAIMFSNLATIGKVRAMGDSPNCIFLQRRFDKYSNKAKISISYRINDKNLYEKKNIIGIVKILEKDINNSIDHKRFNKKKPFSSEGYKEKLIDGLHIFINPFSKNPLSKEIIEIFINEGIMVTTYDIENKALINLNDIDDYLIDRMVQRFDFK